MTTTTTKSAGSAEPRDPATVGAGPVSNQLRRLLETLDAAWAALTDSYAGVSDPQLVEPGVVDDWSVKDILAHVTTWEEEATPMVTTRSTRRPSGHGGNIYRHARERSL